MKFLPIIAVSATLMLLGACSSSSTDDNEPQTTTNTIPAGPDADADTSTDMTGTGQTEGGSSAEPMPNDDISGPADDDQDATGTTSEITIDPQFDPLVTALRRVVSISLLGLNQQISQGELLTEQQENCVGSYDPALGEQLISINCDSALNVAESPIYLFEAGFNNTADCQASLSAGNSDSCVLSVTNVRINTTWFTPEAAEGQRPRPQPKPGGDVSFNLADGSLQLQSLPQPVSGVFDCQFDVVSGGLIDGSTNSGCTDQLSRVTGLINEYLSAQDG